MARRAKRDNTVFLKNCRALVTRWQGGDPAAFGLTELDVDEFEAMLLETLDAVSQAREARSVAKARFLSQRTALAKLRGRFAALVSTIDGRAKREPVGTRGRVYAAAGINPPVQGGPIPTPEMPSELESTLSTNGKIELTFKMEDRGRGGLLYEVQRRLVPLEGETSPWLPLNTIAEKRYTDGDVPLGLREVQYQVRAMRVNGRKSDWSTAHAVRFGTLKSDVDAKADLEAKPEPKPVARTAP